MANNVHVATATRNAALDEVGRDLDNGYLRIYSGTQPANANTALSGNTLLAELRFSATSAAAASSGVLTMSAITSDTSADATGTAAFARCFASDGTTVVLDCSVGTSSADVILNSVSIVSATTVAVTAMTITMAA